MATIIELANSHHLIKLDPDLDQNEQEWRTVYLLPEVLPRLSKELPIWTSTWKIEQSPAQQLDALWEVFCSGETITYGLSFKPLNHLNDGIWELKTADLRLFGWFPIKDCFICGAVDLAFNVKSYNLYAGHSNVTSHLRKKLDLDEPKFIPGENPHDVVSNYNFS